MIRLMTNKEIVEQYIDDVLTGRIAAGKLLKAACRRHLDDLKHGAERGLYFDEQIANDVIDFFPLLTHTDGEYKDQPFVLKPFQAFIVWCMFGWRRKSTGMRRFTRAFISMGRGGGKSAFAAALMLLGFAFDNPIEARGENYTFATKEKQAAIVWNDVKAFIEVDPRLKRYIRVFKKNLHIPSNGSRCEPLGSDSDNSDGLRPHFVVTDEIHAWRNQHRELWDKIITAMSKRRQPMLIVITTAGSDKSELWLELYELARLVVDRDSPVEADEQFVFICEIDDDDDPLDEEVWPKANPMIEHGVVKIEDLRAQARTAKLNRSALNRFKRYYCNKKVSSEEQPITPELWAMGAEDLPSTCDIPAYCGVDLGWRNDLAALASVHPLDLVDVEGTIKRRYAIDVDVWVPSGAPYRLDSQPWAQWIDDGWLNVTEGETTDTAAIYQCLEERIDYHGILSIAMDQNNCREFGTRCVNAYGLEAFWFGQTCGKYNEPVREFLTALAEGRIIHGDNPLLAWCAMNMILKTDTKGYVMPNKEKSKYKIDPIVAVIMALSEAMFAERNGPNYYETNEVEAG